MKENLITTTDPESPAASLDTYLADLIRAGAAGAVDADLFGACLAGACLAGADLTGAIMPDGKIHRGETTPVWGPVLDENGDPIKFIEVSI